MNKINRKFLLNNSGKIGYYEIIYLFPNKVVTKSGNKRKELIIKISVYSRVRRQRGISL